MGVSQRAGVYQCTQIDFGGLCLAGGEQYILFATVEPQGWDGRVNGKWLTTRSDTTSPDDGLYDARNILDFSDLSTTNWMGITAPPEDYDLLGRMEFSNVAVPLPGAVFLGVLGLSVAGHRLRRRQN